MFTLQPTMMSRFPDFLKCCGWYRCIRRLNPAVSSLPSRLSSSQWGGVRDARKRPQWRRQGDTRFLAPSSFRSPPPSPRGAFKGSMMGEEEWFPGKGVRKHLLAWWKASLMFGFFQPSFSCQHQVKKDISDTTMRRRWGVWTRTIVTPVRQWRETKIK